jgi:hypothetical protein
MPCSKEGTTVEDFVVGGTQASCYWETGVLGHSRTFIGSGGEMFQFGKGTGFSQFRDQTKLGSLLLGGKEPGTFSKSKLAGIRSWYIILNSIC